jgi:hypothetical protein
MSGEHIAIDADVLRTQASKVEALAGDVAEAAAAAGTVNIGGGAFGLMCAFLVPVISPVTTATTGAIRASGELLERTGTELRGAVSDWDATEADIEAALKKLHRSLD